MVPDSPKSIAGASPSPIDDGRLRIGWFSSGGGKGSQNLFMAVSSAIGRGDLNAKFSFVFCSREPGEAPETDLFFELAESCGVPLEYLSYRDFKKASGASKPSPEKPLPGWRLDYDRQVMKLLDAYPTDICVLAGYMLIIGPEMCRKYKMLNLHPAEPGGPTGTWREVIWKLIETEAERSGVMMHLVTPELDRGPVVTYCRFPIKGGKFDRYWDQLRTTPAWEMKAKQGEASPLFSLIRQHGAARELPLIVATLHAFSSGTIRIQSSQVVEKNGRLVQGYDLSDEVDKAIKGISWSAPYSQ